VEILLNLRVAYFCFEQCFKYRAIIVKFTTHLLEKFLEKTKVYRNRARQTASRGNLMVIEISF